MIKEDKSWAFDDLTIKDTNYLTHGYHKYPAKFIPQIVSKILLKYSSEGDWVLDPFGGCGTTLVESKLKNRNSIGVDINDVAVLIAKTKISEINPSKIEEYNEILIQKINKIKKIENHYSRANERLKYWFKKKEYNKLMEIYKLIGKVPDNKIKLFYLCCFSNILKNCSIWYSKSIKPMRDPIKNIPDPFVIFEHHLRFMTERNKVFFERLKDETEKGITCIMKKGDARKLGIDSNSMDLVITSPPYMTSYEYAELHQLSSLWFGFAKDMNEIKEDFIGTSFRKSLDENFKSKIAEEITKGLYKKNKSLARHASNYFSDLQMSYKEIYRVLKKEGIACIILGNTEYGSVKIKNAEASLELLKNIGFKPLKIIKRRLTSKTFTPFRDEKGDLQIQEKRQKKQSTNMSISWLLRKLKMEKEKFDFKKFEKVSNKSRYERRIAELTKAGKETSNIKEVVESSLKNLSESSKSFIIYGDPQCGKTEMMIALTAKLLDEGHKIIILLITDNVSLLKQNLERFRNSGIDPSPKNFNEILDNNIKIGESNWIIFCKKNASNLKQLNEKLKDIKNKVIIDDEADFATPNSKINQQDKSKINQLTGELIGTEGIYIGVTATPARLDLNNTHNNKNQKWICFKPHSKYTGQEKFFPVETEDISYKLFFIPDDDPKYITNALFSFMINVAHINLKINSTGEKNYSFLVHTSGRTLDHSRDYQEIIKTFSVLADKSNKEREKYFKQIWEIAKGRYPGEEDEIVSYIMENNQRNNIVVMNSTRDFNRDGSSVADPSTLFTVVVGGNIISRGVTFNNLLSMFFTRSVKNKFHQDTYIQRARMFGSRGEYLQYFELFIPRELYLNWHNCFVLHRLSLESIHSNNGPPVWIYDDKVAVTSGSSIDHSSTLLGSGEMGFALFDYNDNIKNILNDKITNLEKLKQISTQAGESVLPSFLIKYIEKNSSDDEESIKIYTPIIPKWKDVDQKNLKRPKGFISTSSKDFNNFGHHIQIVYNNKNKARVYYKPSGSKLGFIKNIKWEDSALGSA